MTTAVSQFDREMRMIALESSVLGNMVGTMAKVFPSIAEKISALFASANSLPPIPPGQAKDQRFILENMHHVQYLDLADLKVTIPEGFDGNIVLYGKTLDTLLRKHHTQATKGLEQFNIFLSQFISSKDAKTSTIDLTSSYAGYDQDRNATMEQLDTFTKTPSLTSVNLGSLIGRKEDLRAVFDGNGSIYRQLETINLKGIQSGVKHCVDMINIILEQVENDKIANVSPETMKNLAFGATEVAKEVEFFSALYFRVLAYTATVDSITYVTNSYMKNTH